MVTAHSSKFVISASLTDDGAASYMRPNDSWSRDPSEAQVLRDDEQVEERLAVALGQERLVCDPYAVKVRFENGELQFLSARETIRAKGPTTRVRRPDPGG